MNRNAGYAHIEGEMNPPPPFSQGISAIKAKEVAEKFFKLLGVEGKVEQSGGGGGSSPLGKQKW